MRWLIVAILAYACVLAETTLFREGGLALRIEAHRARPDLLLVLGVFLAMSLEPYEVLVTGWALGLASDLVAPYGRLGAKALLFAVALYLVSYLQGSVFRGRVLTQFALTFIVVFAIHWLWGLAARYALGGPLHVFHTVEGAVLDALYSAILAPYLFWLLARLRRPLRLPAGTALD